MKSQSGALFSTRLERYLKGGQPKTLRSLVTVFEDRGFAIVIMLLMFLPATPLPTGGLTHVFEVITMFLCLQMLVGRKTIWLPKRWEHIKLGPLIEKRAIPLILGRVRWFEKHSNPRWSRLFTLPLFDRLVSIIIFVFALAALLSPPFSFLDTLPSLGAVIVCLSIILEDVVMLIVGTLVGAVGVALTIFLGKEAVQLFSHLL